MTADGAPHRGMVFTNNVTQHNAYGIIGTGSGVGLPTLRQYLPHEVVKHNVTGFVCRFTWQYADAVIDLLESHTLRERLDQRTIEKAARSSKPPGSRAI